MERSLKLQSEGELVNAISEAPIPTLASKLVEQEKKEDITKVLEAMSKSFNETLR